MNLEELSLLHIDIGDFWPALTKQVNTAGLTKLSVHSCLVTHSFFQQLEAPRKLQHVFADVVHPLCLEDLLRHSNHIMSLHLNWEEQSIPGVLDVFWETLDRIGPRLHSLGLYVECLDPDEDAISRFTNEGDDRWLRLFRSCPNLTQLGYQLPESGVYPTYSGHLTGTLEGFLVQTASTSTYGKLSNDHAADSSKSNISSMRGNCELCISTTPPLCSSTKNSRFAKPSKK
jgi:hypothetical protein